MRFHPQPASSPEALALLALYHAELRARLGAFDPDRDPRPADDFAPPGGTFLVGYEGGRAVACGGVKVHSAGTVEIKQMFVSAEGRGRGHGRALLAALEDAARALGAKRILLDTAAPLREAHALYVSAGYRPIPAYNDNPYAAAWFEKRFERGAAADTGRPADEA